MIDVPMASECQLGLPNHSEGYVRISVNGKRVYKHRWVYEQEYGPLPKNLVIDHLCRNRNCSELTHLEAVPLGENTRRGGQAAKTECVHGHPFDYANTYLRSGGGRNCRTCVLARQRLRNARRRATSE